MQTLIVAWPNC